MPSPLFAVIINESVSCAIASNDKRNGRSSVMNNVTAKDKVDFRLSKIDELV